MTDPMAELPDLIAELTQQAAQAEDDTAAFLFVTRLNKALAGFPALLGAARHLLEPAGLGPVASRLAGVQEELAAQQAALAADQALAEKLRPALAELTAIRAERNRLTAELAELRRLDALSAELDALRAQRRDFDRRAATLAATAEEEAALAEAARALTETAGGRLSHLEESVSATVARAEDLTRDVALAGQRLRDERERMASLNTELESLLMEFTDLSAEVEVRLPHIDAYRRADRELCDGLGVSPLTAKGSCLTQTRASLTEVEEQLSKIDNALKRALAVHDERHADARRLLGLLP
jgi:DNA repair exonuclease SbcCD ATPase subunit